MEVDNKYKLCMFIVLIACLDVAVGKLTFEAVINNVRRLDLTHLHKFKDLEMGDNMTLFCNDSGKPGRILYRNNESSSPFTIHVQPCRNLGTYGCLWSNQHPLKGGTKHYITLHSQCRVTFEAVVNNEKPVNLTHMYQKQEVNKGDNLTLLCHVDGVPAQLVSRFITSHFPIQVNTCGFFGMFACIPRDAVYSLVNTRHVAFDSICTLLTFDLSPTLARKGDKVKVACTAESSPGTHVRIIKEDTGREFPSSRRRIDNDNEELTYQLEHVTCDDIGIYKCQVVTHFGHVNSEKTAELQMHGCPSMFMKIDVSKVPSTKARLAGTIAYIGDNAKLTCRTEDYPTSLITINREDTGTVLNSSQSNTALGHAEVTFDLRKITCDDMTSYICQATGQDGKVHNRTAELPMSGCHPMLCRNETGAADIVVEVNQSTEVTVCLRDVSTRINVDAFYRGIPALDKLDIDPTKYSGIYHTLIIKFKNIQEYDYGQWLFVVGNFYGAMNMTINLIPDETTGTNLTGTGAGLAVSAIVIILLSLLIIARWRKLKTYLNTKGKRHLDPDGKYSISYKRIHVDTHDEVQATMNDDYNVQNISQLNLFGGMVTYTAEEQRQYREVN